ncbi:MAG: BAPKO_0422 family outer member beta-barrel protein [Bdellovibrionota bacterium]
MHEIKIFLWFALAAAAVAAPAQAATGLNHTGENGLGVVLGEPTGITGKFWLASNHAIDAGLAYAFESYFIVYADYLFNFGGMIHAKHSKFPKELEPYVGVGPVLFISTSSGAPRVYGNAASAGLGVRIPLGLEYFIPKTTLGLFAEIVPGIGLIPATYGILEGGIGIRYYF